MSPLAHLLLAAAVLHAACAASVPKLHSKLIPDLAPDAPKEKDPLDKEAAPVIIVDDVENNLRAKPDDIPVEVIIEDAQPAIKTNEVADDDEEIKRPAVDLRNPGPPQRQEHETQNPDHFSDKKEKLSKVRDTIIQTQDMLRQGVKGVGDDISNWLSTNEQMNAIQQHIQAFRDSFTAQIQKLNEAVQGLAAPEAKPEDVPEQIQVKPNFTEVETRIKILENNFNNGVRALSEGVNIVAILRAEDESAATTAPAQPTPAPAPPATDGGLTMLYQFMNNLQHTFSDSVRNVTDALNNGVANFWNRPTTLAPVVLADSPDGGTTQRPANAWPAWQLPNFNPFQIFNASSPGPILTGLQNVQNSITGNPLYLNIFGTTPGASTTAKPSDASTGSNYVPAKPVDQKQQNTPVATDTEIALPAPAAPPAPVPAPAPIGPIRQMLSNNPVVQGITDTVQRIQNTINNPEKPRDTEKSEDLETKGHGGGNKPAGDSGDNDGDSGMKRPSEDPIKDAIIGESKIPAADKKETNQEVVEKTE